MSRPKLPLCLSCNGNRVAFPATAVAGEFLVEFFETPTSGKLCLAVVRPDGRAVNPNDVDRDRGRCLDCGSPVQD